MDSTAELTAGVLCICLPLVPAIRRKRQNKSPGTVSRSRYLHNLSRQQTANKSDEDPLAREYMELRETRNGVEAQPQAVLTDIEGGNFDSIHDTQFVDPEDRDDGEVGKPKILKTVVIKQTRGVGR